MSDVASSTENIKDILELIENSSIIQNVFYISALLALLFISYMIMKSIFDYKTENRYETLAKKALDAIIEFNSHFSKLKGKE